MASGYTQKLGWSVGLASWLDSPNSKVNRYWRALEYGQKAGTGPLIGMWGDSVGARRGGALSVPTRGRRDQIFVPFGDSREGLRKARFAFWYYITNGRMGRPTNEDLAKLHAQNPSSARRIFFWIMTKASIEQIPFASAQPRRRTNARHYYRKALASFDPMAVEKEILRREVLTMLNGVFKQSKARAAMAAETNQQPRSGRARQEVTGSELRGRMGESAGIVVTAASPQAQDFLRSSGGQFPSGLWQQMLVRVNRQVAAQFQQAVVEQMRNGPRFRPDTGELIRATESPNNRIPR